MAGDYGKEAGITDSTMVVRSALQNAASIAKNILTTEAVVAEAREKQPAAAGMGGHGHDVSRRSRAKPGPSV